MPRIPSLKGTKTAFIYLSLWQRNTVLHSRRCHFPGPAFLCVELEALLGNCVVSFSARCPEHRSRPRNLSRRCPIEPGTARTSRAARCSPSSPSTSQLSSHRVPGPQSQPAAASVAGSMMVGQGSGSTQESWRLNLRSCCRIPSLKLGQDERVVPRSPPSR